MEVGIFGAGQLGRMLALAGYPLGLRFLFVDPSKRAPAGDLAPQLTAAYDAPQSLARLSECDVVSYEFENVPLSAVEPLSRNVPVYPPALALETAQDRLGEKTFAAQLGIKTPRFMPVDTSSDLERAVAELGLPLVVKTRRLGYDGKGQTVIRDGSEVAATMGALNGTPAIAEEWVGFERELSIIAVRGTRGDVVFYPLIENHHEGGILRRSLLPAPNVSAELQARAEHSARSLLEALNYVGVLTLELFQRDGELLFNELAPRVHNSGHATIEGAETSQFENHLRAICGLPLGSIAVVQPTAMLNFVGQLPDLNALYQLPGAHVHLYGKSPRKGRKIGHLTLRAESQDALAEILSRAERIVADSE